MTGAALALWLGSEAARDELAPATCRWCDPPGFDASLRDHLRWQNTGDADAVSYVLAARAAAAAVRAGRYRRARDQAPPDAAWVDALLISEATAVAMAVNQAVKFVVGRERPFVHALPEDGQAAHRAPVRQQPVVLFGARDADVCAGDVRGARSRRCAATGWRPGSGRRGSRWRPRPAYLRIAADRHYASDVTIGAVVGSLAGVAVPYLFHSPKRRFMAAPAPLDHGGIALAVRGIFLDGHPQRVPNPPAMSSARQSRAALDAIGTAFVSDERVRRQSNF